MTKASAVELIKKYDFKVTFFVVGISIEFNGINFNDSTTLDFYQRQRIRG